MNFILKPMKNDDVESAVAVIKNSFDKFVAPGYSKEGVCEFYKSANVQSIKERLASSIFIIAQTLSEKTIGVIEIRNHNHISLLFVDPDYQQNGAAKLLLSSAHYLCDSEKVIEVNASPYAVPIYKKLGFKQQAPEQLKNGIRYVPMKKFR